MKNKRIEALLEGRGENYILPFMWQHGEDEATLREYIGVIHDAGCGAVCLEARPHPDFAGPGWWHDLDILLDEAGKKGMKVWILDDAHFPTGYAAGAVENADISLRKEYLRFARTDVCGPKGEVEIDVDQLIHPFEMPSFSFFDRRENKKVFHDNRLFHLVAWKTGPEDTMTEFIDLTDRVKDGKLYWTVPDGYWKVYALYLTHDGGGREDYINMLDDASCALQIEAVYEPHYARYKDLFGTVIAGFFSDEPCIGNAVGYDFDERVGHKDMPLPWSRYMPEMLRERLGDNWKDLLPVLWADLDHGRTDAKVREGYMDSVTRLVEKCFSYQLGDWCAAHGVQYIGHIVEDNGAHARLGSSMGHYFRSLAGQHMAGIDNIGGQVVIGGGDSVRPKGFSKPGDGEFYHYELGKLGSSHAHIDPRKGGRALCENFGAYGWNTGVRTMQYLADHFLARGINHFTPHAFSPKAFPDPDCPPHFYAHGENPQYRAFGTLVEYMNRVCHLISGGISLPDIAVLYHGESEWAGDYQPEKVVCRELLEHQIDFDIVPADLLGNLEAFDAYLEENALWIGGRPVQALVVPYSRYLPLTAARFIEKAEEAGFPVLFTEAVPDGVSDASEAENARLIPALQACEAVPAGKLAEALSGFITRDITLSPAHRRMTVYHYRDEEGEDILLLLNEDPGEAFDGEVTVRASGRPALYDAKDNCLRPVESEVHGEETVVKLRVGPLEMAIVTFSAEEGDALKAPYRNLLPIPVEGFTVSRAESKEYPHFRDPLTVESPINMARIYPDFSGYYRYEVSVELPEGVKELTIGDCYEAAEVWVNGVRIGTRIAPPYRFDIASAAKEGVNTIVIEVATTLERKMRAMEDSGRPSLGGNPPVSPTGITGEVTVWCEQR